MATFQKIEVVEAEKYEGAPLTVINDQLGEQKATSGDYLLGTERGKIRVLPAKQFEAEFQPYTATPADEQLAAAKAQIDELKGLNDSLTASAVGIAEKLAQAQQDNSALASKITDQTATQAQNVALTEQLASETAKAADLQGKIDALLAVEKQRADAQAALEAAQGAVEDLTK